MKNLSGSGEEHRVKTPTPSDPIEIWPREQSPPNAKVLLSATEAIIEMAKSDPDVDPTKVASIVEKVKSKEPADCWQELFDTREEFDAAPPLSFSIDGFLQSQVITAIAALAGHGKTFLALSIIKSLLFGPGMLWDFFKVPRRFERVVYLIPESMRGPLKTRLVAMNLYEEIGQRLFIRTLSKGPAPALNDKRLLYAVKNAAVVLDTGIRFMSVTDEANASEIAQGLSTDMMNLLTADADNVIPLFHSPKSFEKEIRMTLENMIRGSGELGAALATAWGLKQVDKESNTIHIENLKPRDFQACGPFQLIGRPYINNTGDFNMLKKPGDCGVLLEELPSNHGGGAPQAQKDTKAANLALLRSFIEKDPGLSLEGIVKKFKAAKISIDRSTVSRYQKELRHYEKTQ